MAVGPGPYVFNTIARRSPGACLMSFSAPQPAAPVLPAAPAAPPAFGSAQGPGQKPQAKASQPTFLGSGLVAGAQNLGGKTLLGGAGS
jgi:hypothetical protein